MFFFFPIGFGGGGFFSFLIFYFILRTIFRMIFGRRNTYTWHIDSEEERERQYEQFQQQYRQQYQQYQNQTQGAANASKDWYAVLGVAETSTEDEIKKAYRKLILQYHPDRVESADPAEKERATARFREVQEAYENICRVRGMN